MDNKIIRKRRSLIFFTIYTLVIGALLLTAFWSLRALLLPVVLGVFFAYVCLPLIDYLRSRGVNRTLAILLLFAGFFIFSFGLGQLIGDIIPDKKTMLEQRVKLRYRVYEQYRNLMGLNTMERDPGNMVYKLLGRDFDPLLKEIDERLRLSENDRFVFENFHRYYEEFGIEPVPEKTWEYHQANQKRDDELRQKNSILSGAAVDQTSAAGNTEKMSSTAILNEPDDEPLLIQLIDIVSLWLVMPMVYLIILFDNGRIKKYFVELVPNLFFEVTLTVIDKTNEAIGRYLRGTALECSLVGGSFMILLFLAGVEIRWAVIIGLVAGLANAIPFLGPLIGLVAGLFYALMLDSVDSYLPMVSEQNFFYVIIIIVAIVQLLDNVIFQPFILGASVSLHPLVVIFSVLSGSFLFGMAGMLLAIPTVVVINVVLTTLYRELKAYSLI